MVAAAGTGPCPAVILSPFCIRPVGGPGDRRLRCNAARACSARTGRLQKLPPARATPACRYRQRPRRQPSRIAGQHPAGHAVRRKATSPTASGPASNWCTALPSPWWSRRKTWLELGRLAAHASVASRPSPPPANPINAGRTKPVCYSPQTPRCCTSSVNAEHGGMFNPGADAGEASRPGFVWGCDEPSDNKPTPPANAGP